MSGRVVTECDLPLPMSGLPIRGRKMRQTWIRMICSRHCLETTLCQGEITAVAGEKGVARAVIQARSFGPGRRKTTVTAACRGKKGVMIAATKVPVGLNLIP